MGWPYAPPNAQGLEQITGLYHQIQTFPLPEKTKKFKIFAEYCASIVVELNWTENAYIIISIATIFLFYSNISAAGKKHFCHALFLTFSFEFAEAYSSPVPSGLVVSSWVSMVCIDCRFFQFIQRVKTASLKSNNPDNKTILVFVIRI